MKTQEAKAAVREDIRRGHAHSLAAASRIIEELRMKAPLTPKDKLLIIEAVFAHATETRS
ncbi:hypothetical protein [Rathayibacter sp. PhB127]|uniref:hypothetical protein n=1 Tax=Rathayibacter sp. PhB127 TaxID=2485176 RepID=UPI0011CE0DC1|nr:hypothetical protein [Rathayibacter sp. PhB127]